MRKELSNKLDEHRARLVKEMDVTTMFLASLLSEKVISGEDKARIQVSYDFLLDNDAMLNVVQGNGIFRFSRWGATFLLATRTHTKGANYVFQFFPMAKKKCCQRWGHSSMAPEKR